MLKRLFFIIVLIPFFGNAQIVTPAPSPLATVSQAVGLANVSLEYSRPSLKGRKIFGSSLVPYGQVWRTGANKVPNLTFNKDLNIEGKELKAGTYGIITIPNASSWTVILSKNPNQWGTYEYKETEDAIRFTVKSTLLKEKTEHFTMGFEDFNSTSVHIFISWENTKVRFKLSQDPHAEIMASIAEKTAATDANTDTYFSAAEYYLQHNQDLNKALDWANKVVEKDKQYWTYNLRGSIAAKMGKCDVATADAKAGLPLAEASKDNAYLAKLNQILAACKK
jgi:hypothetical protein